MSAGHGDDLVFVADDRRVSGDLYDLVPTRAVTGGQYTYFPVRTCQQKSGDDGNKYTVP